ncbi:MAG: BTAD domain-containing putative transcriptional regulator, partial [Acidimicrobiia bacterium]
MGADPLDFRILGPLDVLRVNSSIDLGGHKQRSLLALLVIEAPRVVSTDRLLEELWGDAVDGKENALWVYISRLRSVLEPDRQGGQPKSVLVTRDHGYALAVSEDSIDARRFEQLASEGAGLARDDPEQASRLLSQALALWRGSALQDFIYDDFARLEISRLEELRLAALENRIDADLRTGKAGELVVELESLNQEHPLRERFVGQLMLAFYRSGRQAESLRTFERYRLRIGEELGIEPSPEIRRLEEQVLLHDSRIQGPKRLARQAGLKLANPFKGLQPFGERDTGDFYGRDRLVSDILRRLRHGTRLIALVGPSGSGKSSVLKAGILPAIRKGSLEGSDGWLVAQMTPGSQPFYELEAALLKSSLDAPEHFEAQLFDDDTGILRAILRLLPDESSHLLLVIDQFEELFTLVEDEAMRTRFLNQLIPVVDDPHGRVIVVVTLRADYYSQPLRHPDFGERLGEGVINVVPLRPDELESAALKPAAQAGVSIDPTLLAVLLSDVIGEPGGLPLFQYTLTELFDRRRGESLTLASYEAMGGVRGAVRRRAEDIYTSLAVEQQRVVRQLFLRLVTITADDEWSRRRAPGSEVLSLSIDLVDLERVIDLYAKHRLLTLDREPISGAPSIEIAHEALLVEWPRLRDWLLQAKDDLRIRNTLSTAVEEWEREGNDPGYLLASSRLDRYETWSESTTIQLTERERRFLQESLTARDSALEVEQQRRRRETSLQRRAAIRLWGLVGLVVTGVAVLVFSITGLFRPDVPSVGIMYQGSGDRGLNDLALHGFEEAQRRYDLDTAVVTPLADPGEDLKQLCDAHFDAVIVVSAFFYPVGGGGSQCIDTLVIGVDWPPP